MKQLSPHTPHVIIMVGIPGSGKTFFAEKFAETFRVPYVDYQKVATISGNSDATNALVQYQLGELLKTQQSIIIEGNTDTHAARAELVKKARSSGYDSLLVWIQTDPMTAKSRVVKAKDKSRLSSDEYDRQIKQFVAPTAAEKPLVLSGRHTYASQAKIVLQRLSAPRAEISTHSMPPARADQPRRRNIITVR